MLRDLSEFLLVNAPLEEEDYQTSLLSEYNPRVASDRTSRGYATGTSSGSLGSSPNG